MANISFPLSAAMINILLVVIFFTKKKVKNNDTIIYGRLLILSLTESLIACLIVSLLLIFDKNIFIYILDKIDYMIIITEIFTIYQYVESIIHKDSKNKFSIITKIIYFISLILILLLPIEVVFESGVIDISGPCSIIMYTSCAILFIIIACKVIKHSLNKNNNDNKKFIPLYCLVIFGIIMLVVRFFKPEILLISLIMSYSLLIMYFTIENPDIKLLNEVEIAKNKAEKANAAKTDFLSSMSHEIRTPLNGIVGFSEAILEETNLEAAKQDAKDIIESSKSLLEIVNGILNISKLEANKMEIINKDYDFREEIDNVIKLIRTKIGEKPIELNLYIASDVPKYLYGDKSKIKEILINLLTNAVKYTNSGFINVNINCINKNNYSSLIISVEDSGRGIKPDRISKLFDKFERLDEDRNTTIEGAGLGLAITKRLIELMGGNIVVQSVYGSGSKFTCYLKQKISDKKTKEEIAPKETSLDFAGKKILIVDDNELNLKIASKLLSKYKLDIDTCLSGQECIDTLKENSNIDLILLDDMMPHLTGTETLKIIKDQALYKNKIVVLTANAIEGMRDKYLEDGFDDYLSKPIDKKELERVLKKCLSKKRDHVNFDPLPDSLYDISDTVILKMNQDKNPADGSIDDLTPEKTKIIELDKLIAENKEENNKE